MLDDDDQWFSLIAQIDSALEEAKGTGSARFRLLLARLEIMDEVMRSFTNPAARSAQRDLDDAFARLREALIRALRKRMKENPLGFPRDLARQLRELAPELSDECDAVLAGLVLN